MVSRKPDANPSEAQACPGVAVFRTARGHRQLVAESAVYHCEQHIVSLIIGPEFFETQKGNSHFLGPRGVRRFVKKSTLYTCMETPFLANRTQILRGPARKWPSSWRATSTRKFVKKSAVYTITADALPRKSDSNAPKPIFAREWPYFRGPAATGVFFVKEKWRPPV